jgi:two-component system sensor histidine kinase MtrB
MTDLLEISRFDAGFAVLDAEPTDLVPAVHRVVRGLAPVATQAGVTVNVRVPDVPVIAEVDPRRAERILRNLVGNAIEHGEGRPVAVTLGIDDRAIAVTVRDHGIGLRPGEEKLVFNRFWRADPSRARQTGGTGLGLSISLEDARLHGGWLEAWGAPGQGAQFRLTLPVRAGAKLTESPLPLVPLDADVVPGPQPTVAALVLAAAETVSVAPPDSAADAGDGTTESQPNGWTVAESNGEVHLNTAVTIVDTADVDGSGVEGADDADDTQTRPGADRRDRLPSHGVRHD